MKDPATWPVVPEIPHTPDPISMMLGTVPTVHEVAFQLKPVPVKVTIVPFVPVVGDMEMPAVTLKSAHSPTGTSFEGVPLTVTFHTVFVVAKGPITKFPVATRELILHV